MKVSIGKDEWYPVWNVSETSGPGIEIPDELFQRYAANMKEFDEIQAELHKIYSAPRSARASNE